MVLKIGGPLAVVGGVGPGAAAARRLGTGSQSRSHVQILIVRQNTGRGGDSQTLLAIPVKSRLDDATEYLHRYDDAYVRPSKANRT